MIQRPPRSTRTDTLFPYTTLFRSKHGQYITIIFKVFNFPPSSLHFALSSSISEWTGGNPVSSPKSRSEEHTSELQSLMRISYAVFCLKKKKQSKTHNKHTTTLTLM